MEINSPILDSPILKDFKTFHDKGDSWGSAMILLFEVEDYLLFEVADYLLFEVADYLHFERGADIPVEWEFHPGIASDPGEYWEMMKQETTENLIQIGNFLDRVTRILDAKGLSY